jgi:ribonuclease HI
LNPKDAISALKPFELYDATPEVRADTDSKIAEEEKNARWNVRQKTIGKIPEYAMGKDLHCQMDPC